MPSTGDRYRDAHGAVWRVLEVWTGGTVVRVTVGADSLRRVMTIGRLDEMMERVA